MYSIIKGTNRLLDHRVACTNVDSTLIADQRNFKAKNLHIA